MNRGMDRRSRFSGVGRRPAIDSDVVDLVASWLFGRGGVEGTIGPPVSESEGLEESDESEDDDEDDEQNRDKLLRYD